MKNQVTPLSDSKFRTKPGGRALYEHYLGAYSNSTFFSINQAKGSRLELAAKKVGVSMQTTISRRKEYSGLDVIQLKRLKELEQENSRLKRVVADEVLNISTLKEFNKGNY